MRVVLTNFGTRGDFEPLVALATELVAFRHEIIFAIPSFAGEIIDQAGFEYTVIGPSLKDVRDKVNLFWVTQPDAYTSRVQLLEVLSPFSDCLPQVLDDLYEICAGATLLVGGAAQPLARIVHETTGIPFVSVQVSHFGGTGGPAIREAGDKFVNSFRRSIGLPSLRDPFTFGANSPQLALYAMSPHLRPRPANWPSHYHLTGFFFGGDGHKIDPTLSAFMELGTAPVVITFGSMPHVNPAETRATIIRAIQDLGCRAVVQGFGQGDEVSDPMSDIYWAGSVPHTWLFPRASCVVTHGGAGTAAAIFRSGVPGIFVPHGETYDQGYWGQLAQDLGCSIGTVPFQALTPKNLAEAIERSMHDDLIRNSAERLGNSIRAETGVQTARRLIEDLVRKLALSGEF